MLPKSLRNEPVERWAHRGESLRPVDVQMTRLFIQFILHGIRRHDLYECVYCFRSFLSGSYTVPRVGLKHELERLRAESSWAYAFPASRVFYVDVRILASQPLVFNRRLA